MTDRSHEKWTPAEESAICRAFIRGIFPSEIAATHQRSELAIMARLSKLGLLPPLLPDEIDAIKARGHAQSEEIFIKARGFVRSHPALPIGDVTSNFSPSPILMLDRFYYICSTRNIRSIAKFGILSRGEVIRRGMGRVDISLQEAQAKRARPEPVFNRPILEYVPLYINPRNPMLYLRKEMRNEIAILQVSLNAITGRDHVFTDGNAASYATLFSRKSAVIGLAFDALSADYWTDIPDGKRRRCAEVLIYPHVPPALIIGAACFSKGALDACESLLVNAHCTIDRSAFF